jgi:hypothetical protein
MSGYKGSFAMQVLGDAPSLRLRSTSLGLRGTRPGQQASGTPPQARWRSSAIVGVKLVHSVIFLVNSAAILHIFVAGLRDRPSRWTGAALVMALAESTVFVANRGRCPLTDVAESLGAKSGRVSDIFLPRWFADRIPQICTPPLLIGVLALAFNTWRRDARRIGGMCCTTETDSFISYITIDQPLAGLPASKEEPHANRVTCRIDGTGHLHAP